MTKKYISLLRGINVGGHRKIKMAELRALYESLGLTDVRSYIQSGNVVFRAPSERAPEAIERAIEEAIGRQFGFDVPVVLRSQSAWAEIISDNPFPVSEGDDIKSRHVLFLKSKPAPDLVAGLDAGLFAPEKFEVRGANIFLFYVGKYHQSKMSNAFFERHLKLAGTTRNWRTVLKLGEMCAL